MKIKSILLSLFAVCAAFVGCSDIDFPTQLDELAVDNTYVSIPQSGGSCSFKIVAKADWAIDETTIPAAFTVSPMSGGAGEHTITVSAEETQLAVDGDMLIVCNGNKQHITLHQVGMTFPDVKEGKYWIMFNLGDKWVAAKPCTAEIGNEKSYAYVFTDDAFGSFEDGTLASTAANIWTLTKKGEGFYLSDSEGGYLYQSGEYNNFYRAAEGGEYIWTVAQIAPDAYSLLSNTSHMLSYSTKFSNMAAYSSFDASTNIRPYLVPATDPAPEVIAIGETTFNVPIEAGKLLVPAEVQADNVSVNYDADWLHYQGNTAEGFNFTYSKNPGAARTAIVEIHGIYGEYTKDVTLTITQEGSIADATVGEFLAAGVGDAEYRVTGVVTKISNATYGNIYITDYSGTAYVYGVGSKGNFQAAGVKEGDIVTLIGKRGEYGGNPQMNGAQLESVRKVEAISCADFKNLEDDKTKSKYYMLTGVVCHAEESNAKFDLETYVNFGLDDGTANLYVYGVATGYSADGQGGRKMFSTLGVAEGDKLTILAYKTSYNGVIEAVGFYYSHEAAEE